MNPSSITSYVLIAICLVAFGCSKNEPLAPSDENDQTPTRTLLFDGSWTTGWPQLGHDGKPIASEHFIVYSEQSSPESRQRLAELAEEALADILTMLEVTYDDFTFRPDYDTRQIHILADYNQMASSGLAYRDGLIMRALDSPRYGPAGYTPESYRAVLQHEIAHVTEFLLIAEMRYRQANDVWLREGFASYAARLHTVQTVAELDAWKASMQDVLGGGNPISIHVWSNFPPSVLESNTTINYYRFFELATRYLLDPNGNGTIIDDLKMLYKHLGSGTPFRVAFQDRFGMNLGDFEANYWQIMRDYLSQTEE
jgi:hypothetical protein